MVKNIPTVSLVFIGIAIWSSAIAIGIWWISIPMLLMCSVIVYIIMGRYGYKRPEQVETVDITKPVFLGVNYFPISHKLTIFRSLQWQAHIYNDMSDEGEYYYAGSLHKLLNKLEDRLGDKRATDLFHSLSSEFYQVCFNYELKSPPQLKDYLKVV